MARKQQLKAASEIVSPHSPVDNGWVTTETYTLPGGKELKPGMTVMVRGERGARYQFLSHVVRPDGVEWLNFVGGVGRVKMFRAFRPERVSRVLRSRFA